MYNSDAPAAKARRVRGDWKRLSGDCPEQIIAAKKIAAAKSVGYQTQLRIWIAEGIRREGKRRSTHTVGSQIPA